MSEDKKSDYTEVHEEPRRMSEEDVKDYHGLTLNEQGEEYRKEAPQGGIHIEFIDLKAIPWWKSRSRRINGRPSAVRPAGKNGFPCIEIKTHYM